MIFMKKNLLILFLLPLFFSCVVSKKKYEELEYAKRKSDAKASVLKKDVSNKNKKIVSLNADFASLQSEFNDMKNNMSESNAMKTSEIDALSSRVDGLSDNSAKVTQELASSKLSVSKLNTEILQSQNKIALLQAKLLEAKEMYASKNEVINNKNNSIELLKASHEKELKLSEEKIKEAKLKLVALQSNLQDKKDENSSLLRKINNLKAQISKMTNQLKLYKNM